MNFHSGLERPTLEEQEVCKQNCATTAPQTITTIIQHSLNYILFSWCITPFNFNFGQSSPPATSPLIPTASLPLDPKDSMVIAMDPF